jgi:SAM-dependent methyltransferase
VVEEDPQCLACGARSSEVWAHTTDVEYFTTADRFDYRRCAACGVLFIDPVPADRLSEIYPSNYYSYVAEGKGLSSRVKDRLDRRTFAPILRRIAGQRIAVLDVGGGVGHELSIVRAVDPRVADTVVVDLDSAAAEHATAQGHEFVCGRVESYSTDRRFQLVLLLNLIEHVENPGEVLRGLRGLLAPGARIIVKTPNTASLDAHVVRHHDWGGYHCPRHWVLFDEKSFTRLAEEAGLRVEAMRYTQGAPFWTVGVLASLQRHRLVKATRDRPLVRHPLFGPLAAMFAAFDLARSPIAPTSQMVFELVAA